MSINPTNTGLYLPTILKKGENPYRIEAFERRIAHLSKEGGVEEDLKALTLGFLEEDEEILGLFDEKEIISTLVTGPSGLGSWKFQFGLDNPDGPEELISFSLEDVGITIEEIEESLNKKD